MMVQNPSGNQSLRWSRQGVMVEVLPNKQYQIRLDGSRRLTLRNRKFPCKFIPFHSHSEDLLTKVCPTVTIPNPTSQMHPNIDSAGPDQQHPQQVPVPAPPLSWPQHEPAGQPDLQVSDQLPVPVTAPSLHLQWTQKQHHHPS